MIRALVVALLVTSSLVAAVPERPVSETRIGIASGSIPRRTIVASHEGQMLVVWHSDVRGGQALLVDANGQPLAETATGLPLHEPVAAFWRDGSWTILSDSAWARVSENGALLDSAPHALAPPHGVVFDAAWTGEALIVILQQGAGVDARLLAVTYDAALRPRDVREIGTEPSKVHLESNGKSALLVFHDSRDATAMRALLFDRTGAITRERTIHVAQTAVAIGTSGDGYVVMTTDDSVKGAARFIAMHFDDQLDFSTLARFGELVPLFGTSYDVSWDGSVFTFVYTGDSVDGPYIRAARLTASGTLLEIAPIAPMGITVPPAGMVTSVGTSGTTLVLRPTRGDTVGPFHLQLRAGRNGAALAAAADVPLERAALQQINPAVATRATEALVVWQERLGPATYRVYATRVDARGRVLDPQSIALGETLPYTSVAVASNGTGYVVAWHAAAGMRVTHVNADGSIAGTSVVARFNDNAPEGGNVQLFSNGSDYLLLWSEAQFAASQSPIYAIRLRADGTPIDGLPQHLGYHFGPLTGASDGRDYLLITGSDARLVSGTDARLLSQFTIAGYGPLGLWWDGSAYNAVQLDNSAVRLVRITPGGSTTTTSERASYWPPTTLAPDFRATLCDTGGCMGIAPVVESGRAFLREVRISGEPAAFVGRSTEIAPLLTVVRTVSVANAPLLAPFRLQGRTFAAFARPVAEAPYAGVHRVFIIAMQEDVRTRAVKH